MRSPLLAVVVLLGCGSAEQEAASSDAGPASDVAADVPACGFAVGQRICDLPWVGRVRNAATGLATSEPEAPFSLRDVFAKGTQKWVFVHTSAFW